MYGYQLQGPRDFNCNGTNKNNTTAVLQNNCKGIIYQAEYYWADLIAEYNNYFMQLVVAIWMYMELSSIVLRMD